uniref:Uncharacterized protein n=1 Tax=Anguilla anguilla TaxID=7936 RepID=A0A0E9XU37_ANGAN
MKSVSQYIILFEFHYSLVINIIFSRSWSTCLLCS